MAYHSYRGNKRGGFAQRRGRGGSLSAFTKRKEVKPDINKHPLGELLSTVKISDLDLKPSSYFDVSGVAIKECNYVASYNWVDTTSSVILVPGKPPLWTPLKQPQKLQEDNDQYFRDPNAARFPMYPTEPAVRAVFKTSPDFATGDVDVFACGSTMGSLLRFVRSVDKSFRFIVEVVGSTVFLVRKENDPREIIEDVRGYGHTFPEAYTTWEVGVKGSDSHQRIIKYDLGGVKCVVRFECDGYLLEGAESTNDASRQPDQKPTISNLLETFETSAIKSAVSTTEHPLDIQSSGTVVPQDAIFDLKTRSGRSKREIDMADMYPLLWLKQIPNFIIAYHDGFGTFHDVRVQDVKQDIQAWENEKENKIAIKRLTSLLRKIIEIAKLDRMGLLEVYCPEVNRLEIRRQYGEGSHALPPSLREKWEGTKNDGALVDGVDGHFESDSEDTYQSPRALHDSLFDEDSDGGDRDYTACSAEDCGYCGKCMY